MSVSQIPAIIKKHEADVLAEWVALQQRAPRSSTGSIGADQLRSESAEFLRSFSAALQGGNIEDIDAAAWEDVRELLENLSRSRARQGFTPSETASFVFP